MLSAQRLQLRSDFLRAVRRFFFAAAYLEVDTPIRLPEVLPEAEIIPFRSEECSLQTSPELCMKRLLGRGAEQIFQICHCFRKDEIGRHHATEFTMLEWYHAGWDYQNLMSECEGLLQYLAASLSGDSAPCGSGSLEWQDSCVDLSSPWQRLSVAEAFADYAGITPLEAIRAGQFDELLVTKVEPQLGWQAPVFLYDYPAELASLARRKKDDPRLAERFELYICGLELANGFSELIDPGEQRARFEEELEKIRASGREGKLPAKFLDDLAGMRETAGIALGLDRLFMLFCGASSLDEALSFARNEL